MLANRIVLVNVRLEYPSITVPLWMTLDIQSTLEVYKEMMFCCLSTMVYHSCVLNDGVSVWNNGKSQG